MSKNLQLANKEPLFHMVKRDTISIKKAWGIRIIALFFALIACALFIVPITHLNPIEIYKTIIEGAIGNSTRLWTTIREITVLLCIAIGLTPAFKMKFWNIGAEGQVLMGGTMADTLMIYMVDKVSNWVLLILIFIFSAVAGMIWGLIPAFFKAHLNTNETLFTLMLNYVAIQIVSCCIVFWENPKGSNTVGIINSITNSGWFPKVFGMTYGLNIILVALLTIGIFFFLKSSKMGYEISVVGEGVDTANYAGVNVKKVILKTMALSGAICGFTGSLIVSGSSHTISTTIAGGFGFTAIIVAWMAKFNTFAMIPVTAVLIFMQQGSIQIATKFGLNKSASDIITGIILFFLIGCEFFINYKLEFTKIKKEV